MNTLDKARILIVEDEHSVRAAIKHNIRRFLECDIEDAANGKEALDKMLSEEFDLVILDIKMPEMNGFDVMEQAKKSKELPDIIVVTGWDSQQVAQEAISKGASDYISKPITFDALHLKIKSALEKKGKYFPKSS